MPMPSASALPLFRIPAIFRPFPLLTAAESTRHGGISPVPYASLNLGGSTGDSPAHVAENRARFWQALNIDSQRVATSHQVHGAEVLTVNQPGKYEGYDALVSNHRGITLAVTVADCTPILVYDPRRQAIAAIHAGWRGTVQQIARRAIQQMRAAFGTDPADCHAYVGTCIDECSFEVGNEVADQFSAKHRIFNPQVGKYFVNLKKANFDQLRGVGLPESQISLSPYSTVLHNQDYFSYRLEKGQTGRMLACIGMNPIIEQNQGTGE